jgi:molecular chaperone GrpE
MTDHDAVGPGSDSPPPASANADAAAQERTAAELEERVEELEDLWRRALADLDNLRKRLAKDIEHQRAQERARSAAQWLPVVDNLDLALKHAEADRDAIVEGVRAVRDQAVAVLSGLGFPRRDREVGTTFDPARHEAVATMPSAGTPEGTVVDVVRPGYGDGERQLRPAGVVVATGRD